MSGISAIFDAVSFTPPKKSTFDGTHDIKTSCKIGEVFPLDVIPVYPSDNFQMQYTSQAKFSPLVAPAFARMNLKQWSFYVRNADLWDDFQEFVSGVNPKIGKTAYNKGYNNELVHPYFSRNGLLGSLAFTARLNLVNVDLSKINEVTIDGVRVYSISDSYLKSLLASFKSQENLFTISVVDNGKFNNLYIPSLLSLFSEEEAYWLRFRSFYNSLYANLFLCSVANISSSNTELVPLDYSAENKNFMRVNKRPCLLRPGSVMDYLGYPCSDYKSSLRDGSLLKFIRDNAALLAANKNKLFEFFDKYEGVSDGSLGTVKDSLLKCNVANVVELKEFIRFRVDNCMRGDYTLAGFTDTFTKLDQGSSDEDGSVDFLSVLCRYLIWCKQTGNTSTMSDDAPAFDTLLVSSCISSDDVNFDALRFRAYWKIWNDYFRHPNLTYEVPIYSNLGHEEFLNYFVNIADVISEHSDSSGTFYDWRGRNWNDRKVWDYFPDFALYSSGFMATSATSDSSIFGKLLRIAFKSAVVCSLFEPFKHLRERDYITGCLPNTSVVDVVAPIMPSSALSTYSESPWTNDSISGLTHDNTKIDPKRATEDLTNNVGWLDIENLRITQKLKEYFVNLRHTLGSFKDYVKVFFGADISDLTLHRAEFLGGNSQNVSISELVSSSQSDNLPQGSLAGRANSFGQSGFVDKYVNDYGFIITLECLSPLEINVGGLSRQLIRDSRFDYFNPKFAELGDMCVTKKEVSVSPILAGTAKGWYDETFGYTPRYMDLKFIPSHIHGDFLGTLSDWHLDLVQSPFNDLSVELSQAWLEEHTSDRVFSEIYEDSNNCFIWSECRCVYQRALPAVSYEVIA